MKNVTLLFLACCLSLISMAQLKAKVRCDPFDVDILKGTVNNIKPDFTPAEIKEKFPCFTSAEDEGSASKCGGVIYFKDKDLNFFTQRDYVEIGEKFKGHMSIPLLGASRNSLFKWFGNAKLKDDTWDAFEMSYGTLLLHYNAAGKVRLIQFSTKGIDLLNLCE